MAEPEEDPTEPAPLALREATEAPHRADLREAEEPADTEATAPSSMPSLLLCAARATRDLPALLDPRDLLESTERTDRMERMERTDVTLRFSLHLLPSLASSAPLALPDPWDRWDRRDLPAPRDLLESRRRMVPLERWACPDSLDPWDALVAMACVELPELLVASSPCPDLRVLPASRDRRDPQDRRATPVPTDSRTLALPALPEILERPARKDAPDPADLRGLQATMETRDRAATALVS